jgi:hypothetical protein
MRGAAHHNVSVQPRSGPPDLREVNLEKVRHYSSIKKEVL